MLFYRSYFKCPRIWTIWLDIFFIYTFLLWYTSFNVVSLIWFPILWQILCLSCWPSGKNLFCRRFPLHIAYLYWLIEQDCYFTCITLHQEGTDISLWITAPSFIMEEDIYSRPLWHCCWLVISSQCLWYS